MNEATAKALFSSDSAEWETPQALFDELNKEFEFDIDVAASHTNAKCDIYFTKDGGYSNGGVFFAPYNGLNASWCGFKCWMNPPYGRSIGKWLEKALQESQKGATVVCLLPARTDTKWFHDLVLGKATVRFLKGRLKFGNSKNSAPFPSMIAIYEPTVLPSE